MKKSIALLLVVAMILPGMLMAERSYKRPGHQGTFMEGKRMHELLDLTDEQLEKIHDIRIEFQKKNIPLWADLKMARVELREAFADKESDNQVKKAAEKVTASKNKLYMSQIDQKLEVRNVLTDEQLEKIGDRWPMFGLDHHRKFPGRHDDCDRGKMKKGGMRRDYIK
ncbi:MAG TPA: periplasmic heavy metal sensor [bacterium]|nr:periplasmic heavy metal sensor [bacterium]